MSKMKKKELGKGIRALLSSADTENAKKKDSIVRELSNTIAQVSLADIEINPYQPRSEFNIEALEQLAKSIKLHGLVQPITVRHLSSGTYQIISGERRVRACRMIGLKNIPAYIRLADDQGMLEMALIENIQRQDLNPLEVAFSYQRLMDECNINHEEVAQRVAKKRSTVTNYLRLLRLPPAVQNAVRENKISMGHARSLAGVEQIDVQLDLLEQVVDRNWSVRHLEHHLKQLRAPQSNSTAPSSRSSDTSAEIKHVQDELSAALGTRVSLVANASGKGKVIIHFKNNDELQQLINLVRSLD